ncbi:MFS transporter [Candidatus Azambacteria bacterium]|nr:MFS transporter [Candidatus Azambacteria bacterium]
MESRKNIFLWVLYDFANSIVSIVFFLYFAQWVVIDRGISDFRFNVTFTASAALLLCTVPLTGVLLDRFWRRISGLRLTTAFTAICYGACALYAVSDKEVGALIFFTLGLYAYLLSFTFYTPLINDIAPPQKRGLVSGFGITANYLGQFAGLVIALPFSNGSISVFGSAPRAETLLPSVAIFCALSLPTLLFFKEPKRVSHNIPLRMEMKNVFKETKGLLVFPGVAFFLASYFLFNDAVLTAANNFPIFLEQVWHVSDTTKTYLLLAILITSALGGTLSGFLADRFGHKRTLLWVLAGWVFILPTMGLLTNFALFIIASTLMGFWFGANWAVSRLVMSYVAPKGKHNLAFAYFGLAERASSFIGPIVWGLTVSNLIFIGSDRYRIAVLAITVFIVLGFFALMRVQDDRTASVAT